MDAQWPPLDRRRRYAVDVAALQPRVDRIGITPDEIWGSVEPERFPTPA